MGTVHLDTHSMHACAEQQKQIWLGSGACNVEIINSVTRLNTNDIFTRNWNCPKISTTNTTGLAHKELLHRSDSTASGIGIPLRSYKIALVLVLDTRTVPELANIFFSLASIILRYRGLNHEKLCNDE